MPWLELSVRVAHKYAPLVETLLQNEPVLAVTLTDQADNPVLEPRVGATPLWPGVCVTALFPDATPLEPITRLLSLVPGIDRPQQVSIRSVADQKWERVWMERLKPMCFGNDLWIVPGEAAAPTTARHAIRLDPGLAFGTGTHPTTRLCLKWIAGHEFTGQTVVDYGCGSGVLGIAAGIKGAAEVICVDHDPQALLATRDNAEVNGVGKQVTVLAPQDYLCTDAAVLFANILAAPLIELAPVLLGAVQVRGRLLLSGILEHQAEEVSRAFKPQVDRFEQSEDEGWVCLQGRLSAAGV